MTIAHGFAAHQPSGQFKPCEFELPPLGSDDVEIAVESCGICHSDMSMLDNAWGFTQYPFVGGHEVIGRVVTMGNSVLGLKEGDLVGLGWNSRSCMYCDQCIGGDHNLCLSVQGTITHQTAALRIAYDAIGVGRRRFLPASTL